MAQVGLEHDLHRLQAMLRPGREKLRHEVHFWPQFDTLAARIPVSADATQKACEMDRIDRLLEQEGLGPPPSNPMRTRQAGC